MWRINAVLQEFTHGIGGVMPVHRVLIAIGVETDSELFERALHFGAQIRSWEIVQHPSSHLPALKRLF